MERTERQQTRTEHFGAEGVAISSRVLLRGPGCKIILETRDSVRSEEDFINSRTLGTDESMHFAESRSVAGDFVSHRIAE